MVTLQITVSEELAARVSAAAAARGEDVTQFAAEALEHATHETNVETASTTPAPKSLGEELNGLIGLVDSRTAEPGSLRFGDVYEAMFAIVMNEKFPPNRQETK